MVALLACERALHARYAIPGAIATLEATDAALRQQAAVLAADGPTETELERIRKVCVCVVFFFFLCMHPIVDG